MTGRRTGLVDRVVYVVASFVAGSIVAAALTTVVPSAYLVAPPGTTMIVTDTARVTVVVAMGDVEVHLVGSWSASNPTWVSYAPGGIVSTSLCFPRCGEPSRNGSLDTTFTFCHDCPGGGSMFARSPVLTEGLIFVNGGSGPDIVTFPSPFFAVYS